MTEKPRVAILASGGGSTAAAFIRATQEDRSIHTEVGLVICNNPPEKAGIYERIAQLNDEYGLSIPAYTINGKTNPGKSAKGEQTLEESSAIVDLLGRSNISLVALLGFMKRVRGRLLEEWGYHDGDDPFSARIVNTHPGLLPDTRGLHGLGVQEHVLRMGYEFAGQTLHVVSADYDRGPTIAEHSFRHGLIVPAEQSPERERTITALAPVLFELVQRTEKANIGLDIDSFLRAKTA